MVTSVGRWVYNQLFYPPAAPVAAPPQPVDVVRVQELPEKHTEDVCAACTEAFPEAEIRGNNDKKWVVMHPEKNGLVHPIHVECLQRWEQAHDPLQCPSCRAPLNSRSIQQVLGLVPPAPPPPAPPAPPTIMERIAREILLIARHVWRQMPALLVLGCLPWTGLLSVVVIGSSLSQGKLDPSWKILFPSAIGGIIGAVVATALTHLLLNAGLWLAKQTGLRPRPLTKFIVGFAFALAVVITVLKIVLFVAPLLSRLFFQLSVPSNQLSQGLKFLDLLLSDTSYTPGMALGLTPTAIEAASQAWGISMGAVSGACVGIFAAFTTNRTLEHSRILA